MSDQHDRLIALCRTELRDGRDPRARQMAQRLLTDHHAELQQLRRWHR